MGGFVFLILQRVLLDFILVQNNQKSRREYWATRRFACLLVRSFTHLLALHCLLYLRALSFSLLRALARSSFLSLLPCSLTSIALSVRVC